jgi:lipid-A-disaccharide synthase
MSAMRFLISAGEASGDTYGAGLIAALRRREPSAEFFGVAGARMVEAGCDPVVHAHDVSVLGLAEVVSHLPRIWGRFRQLLRAADQRRPDAAILIDFPDFNLRLAKQLHRRGIPVIYYVSPQLWAWRRGRVEQIRCHIRKMLVIFPFEVDFYREYGIDAEFVGHPLADLPATTISRDDFADEYDLNPAKRWIALLPGSRRKEVDLNLGPLLETADLVSQPEITSLDPSAPPRLRGEKNYEWLIPLASTLERAGGAVPGAKFSSGEGGGQITITRDARATLAHARAAVVASGTATVEAALIGTPFCMVYRLSPLSWLAGRWMVDLPHFAMPNLIYTDWRPGTPAGTPAVAEFVQRDFTAPHVAEELDRLIPNGPHRQRVIDALAAVRAKLEGGSVAGTTASDRAADAVLKAVSSPRRHEVTKGMQN